MLSEFVLEAIYFWVDPYYLSTIVLNDNMENWAVSAMCQKPRLLFPINLILFD